MTYIDYLNRFHRWSESHYLPASSKLLYLCMLDLFNRSMWAESIQIDNLRLTILAGVSTEKTAIKARDDLVKNGLISYKKGSKGNPGVYGILEIHCKNYSEYGSESDSDSYSIPDSEYNSENDSKSNSLSDGKNDRHIKNKTVETNTKKKTDISIVRETLFNQFWQEYPKRVGKQQAIKAWNRLKPDEKLFEIMKQALDTWKQTEQWKDTKFVPNPATWLNGRRWEDEIPHDKAVDRPPKLDDDYWAGFYHPTPEERAAPPWHGYKDIE